MNPEAAILLGSAASGAVNGWLCFMVAGSGWRTIGRQTLKSTGFAVALVGGSAAFAFLFGGAASALADVLAASSSAFARLAFDEKLKGST
ncbi:hypothetical protein [Mesorhizobium sp. CN2-181]|uniref:hypothetical protein n=1 Tax=Mesorhizobium yinganensis TaxID=3157707 RepID=UPI0032B7FFC5